VTGFCGHVNDNASALPKLATVIFSEQTFLCGFSQMSDGSQMLGTVQCEDNDTLVVRRDCLTEQVCSATSSVKATSALGRLNRVV